MSLRKSIAEWQHSITQWAIRKGWLDINNPREPLQLLMLAVPNAVPTLRKLRSATRTTACGCG